MDPWSISSNYTQDKIALAENQAQTTFELSPISFYASQTCSVFWAPRSFPRTETLLDRKRFFPNQLSWSRVWEAQKLTGDNLKVDSTEFFHFRLGRFVSAIVLNGTNSHALTQSWQLVPNIAPFVLAELFYAIRFYLSN